MFQTAWRVIENGERRIRVRFGLDKVGGNRYAHFSITGETERRERGRWAEDSCGCIHEEIRKHFPELAKFIPFHLCDETGEPMHYVANAMYWLRGANHAERFVRELPAKCIEHFKSTVLWGVLPEDMNAEVPGLYRQEGEKWLAARLPKLVEKFNEAMAEMHKVGEGMRKA
jgi:hypothetical protein